MSAIKAALEACGKSAGIGEHIAEESFGKLKDALREEKDNLRDAERKQNQIHRTKNDDHFRNQRLKMERLEDEIVDKINIDLQDLRNRQSEFTIVLYGRTMAGKSTLMSILTQDNYDKIGKGAQRTTTDVRSYEWNGLKIWDVPGIAAFGEGGRNDDKLALEKAKTADLALFLITDDAPQPEEAIRLAELKALGKPVLGIVNVKQPLTPDAGNAKRKLDIRQIQKRLNDNARLKEIVRQFQDFAKKGDSKTFEGGYNFDDVPFVYSHLLSAQFSRQENNSELYNLSNFKVVEDFIQEKIIADGPFVRIKTFIETLSRPTQSAVAEFYGLSAETFYAWKAYNEKIDELDNWRRRFVDEVQNRYNTFYSDLESQIDRKISYVVDNYYDSDKAGAAWKSSLEELKLNSQCEIFINKISEDAKEKCRRLAAELTSDLSYSGISIDVQKISMDEITDWQGTAFTIAPILIAIPGIGWAGAAIFAFLAWLFGDSKEKKIREAKAELRKILEEQKQEILKKIGDAVNDNLDKGVFQIQIDGFVKSLRDMREMMRGLAYRQNKVADAINEQYRDLNYELFRNAAMYLQIDHHEKVLTARVVGKKMLVFSTTAVSEEIAEKFSNLIGEKVEFHRKDEANYVVEKFILQSEFDMFKFGDMYFLQLPEYKKAEFKNKYDQIQLAQQLLKDPLIFR